MRPAPRRASVPTASRRGSLRTGAPRTAPIGSAAASWCTSRTPSALRRTSSSTPSAPRSRARAKAARVFSGACRHAPRCARTRGRAAIGARLRAPKKPSEKATCSTFGRECPGQDPCVVVTRPVTLPHSRCRIRTPNLGPACDRAHKTSTAVRPTEGGTEVALTWIRTHDWDTDAWRNRAACRDTSPELFFPIGTTGVALDQIEAAKRVCGQCPSPASASSSRSRPTKRPASGVDSPKKSAVACARVGPRRTPRSRVS